MSSVSYFQRMEPCTPNIAAAHEYSTGALVLVKPDTNPLIRGRHACGFTGRIVGFTPDGGYFVRDVLSDRGRPIAIGSERVSPGSMDGLAILHTRGGRTDSSFSRALSAEKKTTKRALEDTEAAKSEAALLRKQLEAETAKRKKAEGEVDSAKKETAAVIRGDPKHPSLSKVGRKAAKAVAEAAFGDHYREVQLLERHIAASKKEVQRGKVTVERSLEAVKVAMKLKANMARRARTAEYTVKTTKGARAYSKVPTAKLPTEFRERVQAAQADVVAAEERAEAAEDELARLIDALDEPSKLAFDTMVKLS